MRSSYQRAARTPACVLVWLVLVLNGCSRDDAADSDGSSDTSRLDASAVRPGFAEMAQDAGIDFVHENGARGRRYMPETVSGAGGWIDYDGDGLFDLYLVNGNEHSDRGGAGAPSNRLYRNLGQGRFEDVTDRAGVGDRGYGFGLAVGDIDNDGDSDLYVANYGPDVLYRNRGDGTFEDATAAAGIDVPGWSTSAAFLDSDADGWLDLYVCRYVAYDPGRDCRIAGQPTYCSPGEFPGLPDRLYRNLGGERFEDVSERAGVAIASRRAGKSLGVVAFDAEDDGDTDIYVACDQVPNLFFRNEGGGQFREDALLAGLAYSDTGASQAGMGVDAGDVDLDGRQDIVVTNFSDEPNALYLADASGRFRESSKRFGLASPSLSPLGFGVLLFDYDLDGDLDIYAANGHVQDNIAVIRPGMQCAQPDQLFENVDGKELRSIPARDLGPWFERALVGRAVASADFDEDGDEDLLIVNNAGPAVLLQNDLDLRSHWVALRLRGTKSNRDGYGAVIRATIARGESRSERVFECRAARSYAASCDPRVRIGLGRGPVALERATVRWPSGTVQELGGLELDRVHDVVEPGP